LQVVEAKAVTIKRGQLPLSTGLNRRLTSPIELQRAGDEAIYAGHTCAALYPASIQCKPKQAIAPVGQGVQLLVEFDGDQCISMTIIHFRVTLNQVILIRILGYHQNGQTIRRYPAFDDSALRVMKSQRA